MIFLDKWLIAPKKQRHLDALVGRSGELSYYIRRQPFDGILDTEYGKTFTYDVEGAAINSRIKNWIKTVISHVDQSLELDFKEVSEPELAQVQFLAVKHVSKPWTKHTTGESIWDPNGGINSDGMSTILFKKTKSATDQMSTITHELGHALGLKHPKQKPYSPQFSTATTIMSYNDASSADFIYKDFSINDLNAMACLWGLETANPSPLKTRIPFPTKEKCESPVVQPEPYSLDGMPVISPSKGDDYLVAREDNSNIYGDDGDDIIIGSNGGDTLGGGPGNDLLDGGPGIDLLYGHQGKDVFRVREGEGVDEIYFFEQGSDIIHVEHKGGDLSLKKKKNNFTVLLDGQSLVKMKDIEFEFGDCSREITIIENKFIG